MSEHTRRLRPRSTRARIGLLALVLGATALAGFLYVRSRGGNIYHPNARFVPQPAPTLPAGRDRFSWPVYGYSRDHTRFFPAPPRLHPPFRKLWAHGFGSLLEFPPVMRGDHIFQLSDDAVLNAISKHSGRTYWTRHLGRLSASSPAVIGRSVYATVLEIGRAHV